MKAKLFFRDLKQDLKEDGIGDIAAMMTYYAMFALFPMLVFVITLALLVVPAATIQDAMDMAVKTLPGEAAGILTEQVRRMQAAAHGGFAVGAVTLALFGASRASLSLGRALNAVYGNVETRPWWKIQITGILVTLGVAVLLVVALGLLAAGPAIGHVIADRFGLGAAFDVTWSVGRWVFAATLVMFVWAVLYKFLPCTDEPLRVFTPGATVGVLLWVIVSLLFALYVGNFGKYEATYGTLGAVIIFLNWLWISNLALLFGAEINDALGGQKGRGSRRKRDTELRAHPLVRPESGQPAGAP